MTNTRSVMLRAIIVMAGFAALSCGSSPSRQIEHGVVCEPVPDISWIWTVGLDSTARATIEAESKANIVLVKYQAQGTVEILPGCGSAGDYELVETTKSPQTEYIRSGADLCALLPFRARKMTAAYAGDDEWALNYAIAGMNTVSVSEEDLEKSADNCEQATHYVRSMAVGAFELIALAGHGSGDKASVEVVDGGVGAVLSSDPVILESGGDFSSCANKITPAAFASCHAILRLYLEPLK
jgi:hypothetical protein